MSPSTILKRRTALSALVSVTVLCVPLSAEERRRAGGWLLSTRVAFPAWEAANREATGAGFSEFSASEVLVGPAVDLVFGGLRVGLELALDPHHAGVDDGAGATASRSFTALFATVGYDVYHGGILSFYPLVDLAGVRSTVALDPRAAPFLRDALQAYFDPTEVSRRAFVLGLGAGADLLIPIVTSSSEGRRLIVTRDGVRVGAEIAYFFDVAESDWARSGTSLGGGPAGTFGGPQTRIVVGYGSDQEVRGTCEERCGRVDHALRVCSIAHCGLECHSGFGDCDGNARNGCERPLDTLDDCGACGERCHVEHGEPTCGSAVCEIARCDPGFANCDGFVITGCEVDTRRDPAHCGRCFEMCASTERCRQGACVPVASSDAPGAPAP